MVDPKDAQKEIEALEKELLEGHKRLAELRRAQEPEPVEDYELLAPEGPVSLSSAFGGKQDLIVVHNMGRTCPYCTMWADGLNGLLPHLENRAAFVVVSPDTPEVQAEFAGSRGWRFRMLSAASSSFTRDLGYAFERGGKWWMLPGFSTFRRKDDGSVVRIAHGPFGPGDPFNGAFHLFAHLANGVDGWEARFTY